MEGDGLWKCPACGDELPTRRRAAHEATWCPAAQEKAGDSSLREGSDEEEIEEVERHPGNQGLRLRHVGPRADAAGPPLCPHGRIASACVQCLDGEPDSDEDMHPDDCVIPGSADDPLVDGPREASKRAWLSFLFLFLIVAPTCAAGVLLLWEHMSPLVLRVPPQDVDRVKDIFFGKGSWLVHCVNERTDGEYMKVLSKQAERLRPNGVRVAQVHCWTPIPTKKGPRSLARRFKFRDAPPVALLVVDGAPPEFLDSSALNTLARQVLRHPALKREVGRGGAPRSSSRRSGVPPGRRRGATAQGRKEYVGRRPAEEDQESAASDGDANAAPPPTTSTGGGGSAGPGGQAEEEQETEQVDMDT